MWKLLNEMITMTNLRENEDVKKLPEEIQSKLFNFIEKEIPKVHYFKPDGKPKKEWRIFYGKTWDAARDAAWSAAWNAARDAAWDAAWGATRDAARGATRNAARSAARDAARAAAWGAAMDAAWGAALISDYIITSDLDFKDKEKHLAHAKARWEVWQKGYGLLCDVDGVLYVYVIGTPENEKHKHVFKCECGKTKR